MFDANPRVPKRKRHKMLTIECFMMLVGVAMFFDIGNISKKRRKEDILRNSKLRPKIILIFVLFQY